jgi:atypical dual specificity phosphatase
MAEDDNSFEDYMQMHPCSRLPEWACKKVSYLSPYLEKVGEIRPPWRFQWILKRKLALMAWPQYPEHLRYLLKNGIRRLVCLSPECRPPMHLFTEFYYLEVPVEELAAPTMENIKLFMCFVEQGIQMGEAIGIHCRVGRGRSGVLAACYMVRFCGMTAEQAIFQLRRVRPFSIETMEQEQAVQLYYEELCRCPPDDSCWKP